MDPEREPYGKHRRDNAVAANEQNLLLNECGEASAFIDQEFDAAKK